MLSPSGRTVWVLCEKQSVALQRTVVRDLHCQLSCCVEQKIIVVKHSRIMHEARASWDEDFLEVWRMCLVVSAAVITVAYMVG
jgi:anti-sigma-K factor RskA